MQANNKLPILDDRLQAVAAFVREDCVCADIGCDHGKLSAWLAGSGRCKHVFACDMNETPLSHARAEIARVGCDNITCRLGDGLSVVHADEVDDIVLAGLSGVTLTKILQVAPSFWTAHHRFVFVPASKADYLRHWLCMHGFALIAEKPVQAAGRVYTVMHARFTGEKMVPTDFYCAVGEVNDGSQAARAYAQKTIKQLQKQGNDSLAKEVERWFT